MDNIAVLAWNTLYVLHCVIINRNNLWQFRWSWFIMAYLQDHCLKIKRWNNYIISHHVNKSILLVFRNTCMCIIIVLIHLGWINIMCPHFKNGDRSTGWHVDRILAIDHYQQSFHFIKMVTGRQVDIYMPLYVSKILSM